MYLQTNRKVRKQQCSLQKSSSKQAGAATLVFAALALFVTGILTVYTANTNNLYAKSSSNTIRSLQAHQAATAGVEFAINYLSVNQETVLANPVSGQISYTNSDLTNVNLPNNSRFSVTYTNPNPNNYDLIEITSTGLSDDGTSTKVVSQLVQREAGTGITAPPAPIWSQGEVEIEDSSRVINNDTDITVVSGGEVDIQDGGGVVNSNGFSNNPNDPDAGITDYDASVAALTSDEVFNSIFNTDKNATEASADVTLSSNNRRDYSAELNGVTGSTIWINQGSSEAELSGNITIGSPTEPVIFIVNGEADFDGDITIYGLLVVDGPELDIDDNTIVYGGVVTTDKLEIEKDSQVIYDPEVLSRLSINGSSQGTAGVGFAKVMGSWKDF